VSDKLISETSVNSSEMSIASKVDAMSVRTTAADIFSDQPSASGGTFHYHQLAELHRYVNENITYVPDPNSTNYVAPPDETLNTEAGDCDCQAVLVASLFEAIGATTRLVRCESTSGDWHVLPEVYVADSEHTASSEVCPSLSNYYNSYGINYTRFSWDNDNGKYWFLADTAMGEYIGDREILSDNGYIQESGDSWSWYNAEYEYPNSNQNERTPSEQHPDMVFYILAQHDEIDPGFLINSIGSAISDNYVVKKVRSGLLNDKVEHDNYELRYIVTIEFVGPSSDSISSGDLENVPGIQTVYHSFVKNN